MSRRTTSSTVTPSALRTVTTNVRRSFTLEKLERDLHAILTLALGGLPKLARPLPPAAPAEALGDAREQLAVGRRVRLERRRDRVGSGQRGHGVRRQVEVDAALVDRGDVLGRHEAATRVGVDLQP